MLVLITPETLLDFEALKKEPAENHRQFYERLLQHVRLHLAPNGAKAENLINVRADTIIDESCRSAVVEKVSPTAD